VPPLLPGATAADIAVLDDVGHRLAAVALALQDTGTALAAALAATPWRGRAAEAASDRAAASRRAVLAVGPLVATACAAVAGMRDAVAAEAAALASLERAAREVFGRLGGLPGDVLGELRRLARGGGWDGEGPLGVALPLPGARAWREVTRVLGGLLP